MCLFVGIVLANGNNEISSWVRSNVADNEELLCHRNIDGDQFFLVKVDNKFKVGYLIDVTSINSDTPKTYVISWSFIDNEGNYLEADTPPKDLKREYIKLDGKIYAENIAYHYLLTKQVRKISISVELKKYDNQSDAPNNVEQLIDRNELMKIPVCEVFL
jgi:hypothetical protein